MRTAAAMFVAATLIVLSTAGSASAGETTREAFVAAAEPICKEASHESGRLARRGNELFDRDRPRAGANKYIASLRLLLRYVDEVDRLPVAPGDERPVSMWLSGERRWMRIDIKAWGLFKEGAARHRLRRLSRKSERIHRDAHRAVRGFGFDACVAT
jgi:hypothetical protein